uniref:Uncharacterized protein n=1 Tax=Rhizophora mucronata TaxID=61149 RepID=A0A2P2JUA5_RHIMU
MDDEWLMVGAVASFYLQIY